MEESILTEENLNHNAGYLGDLATSLRALSAAAKDVVWRSSSYQLDRDELLHLVSFTLDQADERLRKAIDVFAQAEMLVLGSEQTKEERHV